MKIAKIISEEAILFDNGNMITFQHEQDCCEHNYADFDSVPNDVHASYDFDPYKMIFEFVDGAGFRFGNEEHMIFVPCYSDQNGYYSTEIEIYYYHDGISELVLKGECLEWIDDGGF